MNEKRFIQLINLYIDGEISPKELEELESEVAGDARRRKIYHSYCRLQQASQVAYRKFGPALAETVDLKKYQILARTSNRCLRRGLLYSSGALAAACMTVAAAVAVLQDSHWGASSGSSSAETLYGSVEVLEPSAINTRGASGSEFAASDESEPFFFAGRPSSGSSERKAAFLKSERELFQSSARSKWHEQFSNDSSKKVIRGDASFDAVSELASFEFQR